MKHQKQSTLTSSTSMGVVKCPHCGGIHEIELTTQTKINQDIPEYLMPIKPPMPLGEVTPEDYNFNPMPIVNLGGTPSVLNGMAGVGVSFNLAEIEQRIKEASGMPKQYFEEEPKNETATEASVREILSRNPATYKGQRVPTFEELNEIEDIKEEIGQALMETVKGDNMAVTEALEYGTPVEEFTEEIELEGWGTNKPLLSTGKICPDCGGMAVSQGNCCTCVVCGWSACG